MQIFKYIFSIIGVIPCNMKMYYDTNVEHLLITTSQQIKMYFLL